MKGATLRTAPILILLAIGGCNSAGGPPPGPADVTVELDAYSGRPNPRWTLTPAEAGDLAAHFRELAPADADAIPEGVLGYRGFVILNPGGEGGIPSEAYIAREGLVRVGGDDPGTGSIRRDDGALERWLIGLAAERGYGEVFGR